MEVHNCLARCRAVVLDQIQSVCSQFVFHENCHLLRGGQGTGCPFIRNLIKILKVFLGQNQGMSPGRRSHIQNHAIPFILIQGSGRNLSVCYLTENTIVIFHT